MRTLHSILRGVCGFLKGIPKKCYRNCAVIAIGSIILAVAAFHSNSFAASGKNRITAAENAGTENAGSEKPEEDSVTEAKAQDINIEEPIDESIESIQAVTSNPEAVIVRRTAASAVRQAAENVYENRTVIKLQGDDYENLLKIVEAEATGSDVKGKILVANVIINRVHSPRFPSTVTEVVFQKNGNTAQFSPTIDGRLSKAVISDDTVEAVNRALKGEDYSQGALFFSARSHADPTNMSWFDENLQWLQAYDGHEFYTFY